VHLLRVGFGREALAHAAEQLSLEPSKGPCRIFPPGADEAFDHPQPAGLSRAVDPNQLLTARAAR